jgi:hypothetical protein
MVCETNIQIKEALLSLKNYIKETVNLSLNRPVDEINKKLKTMLIFNDTVNGIEGNIPIEYHISFLKKLDKNEVDDDRLKDKLNENVENYKEYTTRKFANILV